MSAISATVREMMASVSPIFWFTSTMIVSLGAKPIRV
jgi:hypothetical protein